MRIGIDIDNTIVNTTECVLEFINERFPDINLRMKDVKEYWMEKIMPQGYEWAIPFAFNSKEMWKRVKMIDGAALFIEKLFNAGNEIYFVSSTTPENVRKKIKHLCRNLHIPEGYIQNHFINIVNKGLLRLDILIDDFLGNLICDRTYVSICIDYPWNQYETDSTTFIRVKNWEEIYNLIQDENFRRFIDSHHLFIENK